MSGDDWNDPYWDESWREDEPICDYGCAEFCVDPFLRSIGNCFCCWAYIEAVEIEAGVYDFAFFITYAETGWYDVWAQDHLMQISLLSTQSEESEC